MKTDALKLAHRAGAVAIVALLLAVAWARMPSRGAFVPRPLSRDLSDLAVACLASGEIRPPLELLPDGDLGAIVEIVGRLIGSYERADFGSFVALRGGDVEGIATRRAEDLEPLRALARELRIPEEELEADWIGVFESFWRAYYECTPVARFVPEATRVELHGEGLSVRSVEAWAETFIALRDRVPGPWIQHELVIPHRRDIERVARDAGPLRWLDVELGFETREGSRARLVARFVWDGVLQEWFLHDAASIYAVGDRSQRHLIL